jgi:hypothetical protein
MEFVSDRCLELTACTAGELVGVGAFSFSTMIHPADADADAVHAEARAAWQRLRGATGGKRRAGGRTVRPPAHTESG